MRAAYYEANGSARDVLKVGTLDDPVPGPGEVRVKLMTSGVNPSDVKSRAGRTRKIAFPRVVPDSDGAGIIDQVGPGVPAGRVGERVWTWNGQWKRASGTCAEYIALPAALAVPLPAHISFAAGACLGIPAMTAYHAVATAGLDSASTVLIAGGAGAVGNYAVQFAKARGAVVITTVSSDAKAKLARDAGADHVIDYKRTDVAAAVKDLTDGAGVDTVIELDIAANARLMPAILRPRGTIVIYGTGAQEGVVPLQYFLTNAITLRFIFVYELTREEREDAVGTISRMLENDTLIHNIAATYPLSDSVAAHEAVESGTVMGNVVVQIV